MVAVKVGFLWKITQTSSITLTLVRSCTASKADLKGVLLANWKPLTSTCRNKKHHKINPWWLQVVSLATQYICKNILYFYVPQTTAAWSFQRASRTCDPCLGSGEPPQSVPADPQGRPAKIKANNEGNLEHTEEQSSFSQPSMEHVFLFKKMWGL